MWQILLEPQSHGHTVEISLLVSADVSGSLSTEYCEQSRQHLVIININILEMDNHGQTLSNEDRLFMAQPPCVKLQPQGAFTLTVEAGKVRRGQCL